MNPTTTSSGSSTRSSMPGTPRSRTTVLVLVLVLAATVICVAQLLSAHWQQLLLGQLPPATPEVALDNPAQLPAALSPGVPHRLTVTASVHNPSSTSVSEPWSFTTEDARPGPGIPIATGTVASPALGTGRIVIDRTIVCQRPMSRYRITVPGTAVAVSFNIACP